MTFWESIVLGVIQGATEFLPVSSSGHLVMGQALLDIRIPGVLFEVTVHLATLVSILVAYRTRVSTLALDAARGRAGAWMYLTFLVVATIPAAVVGLLWRDRLESLFDAPVTVAFALFVTGGLLWSTRSVLRGRGTADEEGDRRDAASPETGTGYARVGMTTALAMGLAQSFALVPGISRSGATVVVALWLGVEPREAAAFSFLMAIPAIGGAAVLSIPEMTEAGQGIGVNVLLAGGVAAAVTGVLAIRTFVAMLRHRSFHHFGLYCWVAGGLFLGYLLLG